MNSFIDLMKNDVWSEADIVNRTESMIHSEFSKEAEIILNRKVTGAVVGSHTLTAEEQGDVVRYTIASGRAQLAGIEARADMALLHEVFAVEAAYRRLALPLVEPATEDRTDPVTQALTVVTVNQPALDADTAARSAAQAVLDSASAAVQDLVLLRNPAPEALP